MAGMGKMMQQARQMQKKLARIQEELEQTRVEGSAGGGMVKAVVNGKKELISIKINPDAVEKDDIQILEDMVLAAVRQASEQAEAVSREQMSALTGGLSIPGLGI